MNDLQFWVVALLTFLYGVQVLSDVYYIGAGGRKITRSRGWYIYGFVVDGLLLFGVYWAFWRV